MFYRLTRVSFSAQPFVQRELLSFNAGMKMLEGYGRMALDQIATRLLHNKV